MKRRKFITLLGGAAAWTAAFVQRLRELGWVEGRTIRIEYRWGDGRADRLPEIAAEYVRLKVDVIVTTGTPVPVLKEATSTIPIVFTIANDPVGAGLVRSLARPGGNVTGLSQLAADLGGKRVELLRVMAAGHAAAPLTSVMKSRRFTRSPRRRARAGKTAWSGLEPWQSSY
jgi:putative tryptophan/tyrosine transport system substrate-binding protein